MNTLEQLTPKKLWQWFAKVCEIPHPSYHEESLAKYIVQWAENKQLWVERDDVGNILIRKPATPGMGDRRKVALQAHLDMVPQKNNGTEHNFETDPIKAYIDGEWVTAEGTTLGADNGIGMASALAILDSDDLVHPALEVLLTMTEESGMEGAIGLRDNWLQSEWLINTDTEENGEIYVGCAGGVNADIHFPLTYTENRFDNSFEISLKGLRGGHSGVDIDKGRANAIKVIGTVLAFLSQQHFEFSIQKIQGGSLRNAIPREATVQIATDATQGILDRAIAQILTSLKDELSGVESNIQLQLVPCTHDREVLSELCNKKVLAFLSGVTNGVVRFSDRLDNVVETSSSLGVLDIKERSLVAVILIRSLIESGKQHLMYNLTAFCSQLGMSIKFGSDYPGWEPELDSELLKLTQTYYQAQQTEMVKIKVIHAGLECGLLKKHYPGMAMVSIGPTIINAHSPDEKVLISGVEEYWKVLTNLLANIPESQQAL